MSAETQPGIPWQNLALIHDRLGGDASRDPQLEDVDDASVIDRLNPELSESVPDYVRDNFDYFLSSQADRKLRHGFIRRGVTPTNNLRKYFDLSQPEFWNERLGIRNPLHRNTHAFGHIIARLEAEHPALWAEAVAAEQAYQLAVKQHEEAARTYVHTADMPKIVVESREAATWHNRAVMSRVFDVIAPQMNAEGFEPVSACK